MSKTLVFIFLAISQIAIAQAPPVTNVATVKSKVEKLKDTMTLSEKWLTPLQTTLNNYYAEFEKGCDISRRHFQTGIVTATQRSCLNQKFSGIEMTARNVEKQVQSLKKNITDAKAEYVELLKQARKDYTPNDVLELSTLSGDLNSLAARNEVDQLRLQMYRSELQRKQKEFEDSVEYAFTASTIQNTLNSPLLCTSVQRCSSNANAPGTLSTSDIKKSILNSASSSAIKNSTRKPTGVAK
ncbi:MAG: hypothetical protein JNL11_16235 [Bdellovibrionaceae bacterium]|nr:hypothetical protein [Pseudobdellovibrionaceae bacterium]